MNLLLQKSGVQEFSIKESKVPEIGDFPVVTTDKLRYCDTDRQGHVNNAVFLTFLETGRVELLYNPVRRLRR